MLAFIAAVVMANSKTIAVRSVIATSVEIVLGAEAGRVEHGAARLLEQRLTETGLTKVTTVPEDGIPGDNRPSETNNKVRVLLGIPAHHRMISRWMNDHRIKPLTEHDPGPEGFLVSSAFPSAPITLIGAGVDDRGVVYAVGELLRRTEQAIGGLRVPEALNARSAPAFEVRGTQIGQSSVMLEKAHARKWTEAERQHAMADIILAGANTIQIGGEETDQADPALGYLADLGIKTLCHYSVNAGSGPPEWQAQESIGRGGYLCPSVPEARAALLKRCDEAFRSSPDYDYVRLVGGDGGGCECDRCRPYGHVFIRLCEDQAEIIHKYHPKAQIFITNQKFDNASDEAIFAYMQEKPRPWLRAFCYGPGSDAMSWQPGHRQTHRMDLFRYPGFSPPSRYLHEILHQLPPGQDLVFYNEITHWRYSEFGYVQAYPRPDKNGDQPPPWGHDIYERMPDRYLTQVYDRLTFFAWPRFYYRMFGETVRYGIGDCTHSSGTQDHFNQWMWQRLLWNPHQSVEEAVDCYCHAWFGPEAAPLMAKALFQLEQNLQDDPAVPLPRKPGIDAYYTLVSNAGKCMLPSVRAKNWLWLEHMQKAAIDRHTARAVGAQLAAQKQIEQLISRSLSSTAYRPGALIAEAQRLLDQPIETELMRSLEAQAIRCGDESNRLYGVRSEGIYGLNHDFVGLGWTRTQLHAASIAKPGEQREMLAEIADYENPGPGGFYDDCGVAGKMPHLVNGYPYDFGQPLVAGMLSESCRYSQRTMCSTQDEARGVALRYDGLDPKVRYRVRITLVRPKFQPRYAGMMNQHSESLYANDMLLANGIEVPESVPQMFRLEIPLAETRSGTLTLRFQKMPDVASGDRVTVEQWRNSGGWGTIVSEVWLEPLRE